jgi:hypothetical protein
MQDWERRQTHYDYVHALCEKDGIVQDKSGKIWKYEGRKVQDALKKGGHSSLGYEECCCSKLKD